VTVTLAGREVARHQRCWAKHQSFTEPEQANAAAAMRAQQTHRSPPADEVERRSLTDYDAAFGLDEQVA